MRLFVLASVLLVAFADFEEDSALGCCVGTHDKCNQDDKSKCKKMADKHGHDCSWSTDRNGASIFHTQNIKPNHISTLCMISLRLWHSGAGLLLWHARAL